MGKYDFKISIGPEEAFKLIKENQGAELVHEEFFNLGEGKHIGILVYEKYYFRAGNKVALIIIVDNFKGYTEVRSISTGSSSSAFFDLDWGAADNFAGSVKSILKDFID